MQNTPYVIIICLYIIYLHTYTHCIYVYIYIIQLYAYPPVIKHGNWIAFKARILAGKLSINWELHGIAHVSLPEGIHIHTYTLHIRYPH